VNAAINEALGVAIREAQLAYQYAPGSYTHSALTACISAQAHTVPGPDWITETIDWNSREGEAA
jgi:hypothetical protein